MSADRGANATIDTPPTDAGPGDGIALPRWRRLSIVLWAVLLGFLFAAPALFHLDDAGDFLVRNTIRLALAYWALAVALMLRKDPSARSAWTLACAAYLVHVAMSFEHVHRWSHRNAVAHVQAVSGFGQGIFVSYFFTLLWLADLIWWWVDHSSHEARPRWIDWSIHSFMVFIIINGAIIYENGAIRWVSSAGLAFLALIWIGTLRPPRASR